MHSLARFSARSEIEGGGAIILTAHVHIPERQRNVAHQPLCLFATLPAEVYRQA
jgi:hypothetical protein